MSVAQQPVTFRRDRFGECWHLIPAGELGVRSRTLCGQPRQGTPLSETYAEVEPAPPECICELCTAVYSNRLGGDHAAGTTHDETDQFRHAHPPAR
jgi:hypothetical protein